MNRAGGLLATLILGGGAAMLPAQSGIRLTPMGRAVVLATHANPIPFGGALTEVRVVQPIFILGARALGGHLLGTATLDFESVTMPGGELTPGAWGEGFVDRRHPHTTVHELNVAAVDLLGRLDGRGRLGVVVGKGFVPFGTDDPMSRPISRYPVNHHLSQILERAIAVVQYDIGRLTFEGALFNGDEPERPGQWPLLRKGDGTWRFGDSWSARVTMRPVKGLEVQGSRATAHSPEHRPGAGGDAVKSSASLRWRDTRQWGERYLMAEWARTSELDGFFVFHSWLAEGMVRRGRWAASYRYELTDRPEEERLVDPFRTRRPHFENSNLGIGRWSLHTLHLGADVLKSGAPVNVAVFLEGTLGGVTKRDAAIFDPVALYGTSVVRQLSAGVSFDWRMRGHRMGRYGVLDAMHIDPAGHDMMEHQ
ncbi:MAG: hypothetical protein ABJC19_00640 [Gemmatimonadota bacterium]